MPVEIRELIIRAVVEQPEPDPVDETRAPAAAAARESQAIVEECVKQVLKILKKSGER